MPNFFPGHRKTDTPSTATATARGLDTRHTNRRPNTRAVVRETVEME
jgi:hypothetical protein